MLYITTDFSYKTIEEGIKTKKLGFVDCPPCCFSLDLSWGEFEDMMDELMQLEIDAFNTPNGEMPSENDFLYKKYEKYGWLWDMFYNADIREE